MKILGISAYYHDSAIALIEDGKIIYAAQEERFSRIKHDAAFPSLAIKSCLEFTRTQTHDIDAVVYYEKPFLKFERLIETYLATVPKGFSSFRHALPVWLKEKLFQKKLISDELQKLGFNKSTCKDLLFCEHHLSHAASAFYPSPFQEALILTMDGVGEWATTSVSIGYDHKIKKIKEIHFPHSIGLLYSAFTTYCGFKVNSGEYKLMGLAPYGEAIYKDLIYKYLIDVKEDGSFALNMEYFDYCHGLTMTSERFHQLFGAPPRQTESPLEPRHMNLAASIQVVTEEIIIKIVRALTKEYGIMNLCLAGGVALNCVANGRLLSESHISNLWIQPASGDAGGALGAALAIYYDLHNTSSNSTRLTEMEGSYWGPSYSDEQIAAHLSQLGARFQKLSRRELLSQASQDLADHHSLGWYQGAMEFGPRALGNRSILANPISPNTQRELNLQIKFRESFRPFAPSVIEEDAHYWFDLPCKYSPYMLLVAPVKNQHHLEIPDEKNSLFGIDKLNIHRSTIPAVTHVDFSARVQTVNKKHNLLYYDLIQSFKEKTGVGVLVNTSFNVRGEPIVNSPEEAFRCFMGTGLSRLAIGSFYLRKEEQTESLIKNHKDQFELD